MILTNPYAIFYNRDNEIVAGIVEMPAKEHGMYAKSDEEFNESHYQLQLKQALANPIPFKEKKDEEKVRELVENIVPVNEFIKNETWVPKIGKPYKIDREIEIRLLNCGEQYIACIDADECPSDKACCNPKQFAFLKKDALDTGARLPEQKEESQEKLWDDVLSLQGMFTDQGVCYDGNRAEFLEKLKSKFIIHRKP